MNLEIVTFMFLHKNNERYNSHFVYFLWPFRKGSNEGNERNDSFGELEIRATSSMAFENFYPTSTHRRS